MSRLIPAPEQTEATRPDRSTWVSANAGSGKTHVLTMRVARLLLAGALPQKILCLTYTKAAAAEMQSRLFQTLGRWAMLPENELARQLAELSGRADPITDLDLLAGARRLFARALETPGGLKIQTIHAFCDSLLRRFPLEAGISPRFEVADDRRLRAMLADTRSDMARASEDGHDPAFDLIAARLNEGSIDQLAEGVVTNRKQIDPADPDHILAAHFGRAALDGEIAAARTALAELNWEQFAALREVLLEKGKQFDRPVGEDLPLDPALRRKDPAGAVDQLVRRMLTGKFEPRKPKGFPSADVKSARPQSVDELVLLTDWALRARDRILAARMVNRTQDFYAFSRALLAGLDHEKSISRLLDFDDLVTGAAEMLTQRHMRAWVLYKLDQGIDHILVDEAQDTSPAQWEVITAIAKEFFSGEGARPEARSVFVVGDEKQSIYSFQGAQPKAFGAMRSYFEAELAGVGAALGTPRLETSFRSAPAVLDFVDAVFDGQRAAGLTTRGEPIRHRSNRGTDQGRVDLWPLVPRLEDAEQPPWWEPVDAVSGADAKEVLAGCVADRIAGLLAGERLPQRDGHEGRLVRPDDILVLVRRRDRLARGIIRELKAKGVPVAGADRLALADELAVKDLLAVAKVALMPSDDLSLAALLRSPLCDVSEQQLFDLAHGREGTLWQSVRSAPGHAVDAAFLDDMARQAGFLRPYEFFEHILVGHHGRAKLIARLGSEAEDPIDELLQQALTFEQQETPTLASFIAWVEAGGIEVKREMDRGSGEVRVMTVHGAKGLESPIVILPDTVDSGRAGGTRPVLLTAEGDGNQPPLTIWAGSKTDDDPVTSAARAEADARDQAERKRLLYVALTRAEDWLILCGAEMKQSAPETWYELLAEGMAHCAATTAQVTEHPSPTGTGTMQRFETGSPGAPRLDPDPGPAPRVPAPERPAWLGPASPETRVERGSPSGIAKSGEGAGGSGIGRAAALRRGSAVHLILERLADRPPERLRRDGTDLLTGMFPDLPEEIRADAVAEAEVVLRMPEAGLLFGPESLAEVSVAVDPPNQGLRMIGRIDRLILTPDSALIVDIKTDAQPPARAEDIDRAYLAQLGAYASAISAQWPEKTVSLAILWTSAPILMRIDYVAAQSAFRQTSFRRNSGS